MSPDRQQRIIIFLIIASFIGILILIFRKTFAFSCPQTDEDVCKVLENYQAMSKKNLHGLYTVTNENDESVYVVKWQKQLENRSITAVDEEETILEAVLTQEYLYLKDFTDDKWWMQKVTDPEYSATYVPFDPYQYFFELDPVLFDPETTYTRIGEVKCGNTQCIRYEVSSSKQSPDLQRYIYVTFQNKKLYIVVDVSTSASHEIKLAEAKESVIVPENIKTPSADQNIFLDYLTKREKRREQNLEYLKQFQVEREKAEGVPVEGSIEESTPSAN